MNADTPIIKTYVWHEGKCFFVSTIERDSSAGDMPCRYTETMVWEYDWEGRERGKQVLEGDGGAGSIRTHMEIVWEIKIGGIDAAKKLLDNCQ